MCTVGPLTVPFFLTVGLTRAVYIGTEAASGPTMHLPKIDKTVRAPVADVEAIGNPSPPFSPWSQSADRRVARAAMASTSMRRSRRSAWNSALQSTGSSRWSASR